MDIGKIGLVAIVMVCSAAVLTSPASARKNAQSRDAVMELCITKAQREFPDPGEAEPFFRARTAAYKACMTQHGQAP
jgi:hypothetical protein